MWILTALVLCALKGWVNIWPLVFLYDWADEITWGMGFLLLLIAGLDALFSALAVALLENKRLFSGGAMALCAFFDAASLYLMLLLAVCKHGFPWTARSLGAPFCFALVCLSALLVFPLLSWRKAKKSLYVGELSGFLLRFTSK